MKETNKKLRSGKQPNVGSRLFGGLILLTMITVVLSINYYRDVRILDKTIHDIIEHPYAVSNSVRDIEINIHAIHRSMKDVTLAKNDAELSNTIQIINNYEKIVYERFAKVKDKFLGDPNDVDIAFNTFANWKQIRDEVIDLVAKNETDEAAEITKGKGADHVKLLLEQTKVMIDFADSKAKDFNKHSLKITKAVDTKTIIFNLVAVFLGVLTATWIVYTINRPIERLFKRFHQFSKENFRDKLPKETKNKLVLIEFMMNELENNQSILELSVKDKTKELRQAKSVLANAIENAKIGMVTVSLEGKFLNSNHAFSQFIGYSKEELLNLTFNEITHNDDKNIGTNFVKSMLAGENLSSTYEKRYIHKNGKIVYASLTSALVKDENNKPLNFFTQIIDITKQKKYENELIKQKANLENEVNSRAKTIDEKREKLEKSQLALTYLLEDVNDIRQQLEDSNIKLIGANKELEAFSYSVSHDLKAPLRAIDGFSRILIEDHNESLNDEGKRVLNIVIENANKMRALIDDILELSRLGRKPLVFSEINLNLIVKSIILDFESLIGDRKISWKIHDFQNIVGDRVLIKQLLLNLISNAIKFTGNKEEAIIEVGFETVGKETIYFVKDNGVGFEMKYVEKVFEVFQRLHSNEEFEGTGIGLAIVRRIIDKHDGKIRIESKINSGTQIYFSLNEHKN